MWGWVNKSYSRRDPQFYYKMGTIVPILQFFTRQLHRIVRSHVNCWYLDSHQVLHLHTSEWVYLSTTNSLTKAVCNCIMARGSCSTSTHLMRRVLLGAVQYRWTCLSALNFIQPLHACAHHAYRSGFTACTTSDQRTSTNGCSKNCGEFETIRL